MKSQPLAKVVVSLIGFYSIFLAMMMAGIRVSEIGVALLSGNPSTFGPMAGMMVAQFIFPLLLGIYLIRKSARIAARLFPQNEEIANGGQLDEERLYCWSFSLLGLFFLSTTVPAFAKFLVVQYIANMPSMSHLAGAQRDFLPAHLPDILFHVVSVGFSLYVFLRGKSLAAFVLSLRKR